MPWAVMHTGLHFGLSQCKLKLGVLILKMIRMQDDDSRALNPAQESLPYVGLVQWYRSHVLLMLPQEMHVVNTLM